MDLKTEVAGIELKHPIFNASGPSCTTEEELDTLLNSKASAVMTKSCTLEHRDGNPGKRYVEFGQNSINSMGLPNPGYEHFLKLVAKPGYDRKPVFISISGMKLEDNFIMGPPFSRLDNVKALEFNLSCPNVPGKPQLCYDPEAVYAFVNQMKFVNMIPIPWGVKLAPYFDPVHINEIADILNGSGVRFVTCINSAGNGLVIDPETEKPLIDPKGGLGGIGGQLIKPFGLSNVYQFRKALEPEINIIGVGGIQNGFDVFEYLLVGADAVQIGTTFQSEGPTIFSRVQEELSYIMTNKGYNSVSDFKGKITL